MAFRLSPEEADLLDTYVRLSGLTKQDYITRRLLDKAVVVQGNPRVFKVLRNELAAVLDELRRIEAGGGVADELMDTIELIAGSVCANRRGTAALKSTWDEYSRKNDGKQSPGERFGGAVAANAPGQRPGVSAHGFYARPL